MAKVKFEMIIAYKMPNSKEKHYLTNEQLAKRFLPYNYDEQVKKMFDRGLVTEDADLMAFIASTLGRLDLTTVRLFMAYVHEQAEMLANQIIDLENKTLESTTTQLKYNILKKQLALINQYFGGQECQALGSQECQTMGSQECQTQDIFQTNLEPAKNARASGDYHNCRTIVPRLTDEEKSQIIKLYNRKQAALEIRNKLKVMTPRFSVGEIVGALDKENKWWMARILQVVKYEGGYAYYVEFCNWGPQFNDLIVDPKRLRWYNPRRHKLFRGTLTTNHGVDLNEDSELKDCPIDEPTRLTNVCPSKKSGFKVVKPVMKKNIRMKEPKNKREKQIIINPESEEDANNSDVEKYMADYIIEEVD